MPQLLIESTLLHNGRGASLPTGHVGVPLNEYGLKVPYHFDSDHQRNGDEVREDQDPGAYFDKINKEWQLIEDWETCFVEFFAKGEVVG